MATQNHFYETSRGRERTRREWRRSAPGRRTRRTGAMAACSSSRAYFASLRSAGPASACIGSSVTSGRMVLPARCSWAALCTWRSSLQRGCGSTYSRVSSSHRCSSLATIRSQCRSLSGSRRGFRDTSKRGEDRFGKCSHSFERRMAPPSSVSCRTFGACACCVCMRVCARDLCVFVQQDG